MGIPSKFGAIKFGSVKFAGALITDDTPVFSATIKPRTRISRIDERTRLSVMNIRSRLEMY